MPISKRLYWIDNCKVIAIFLVVLGHNYHEVVINTWIYSFHMPLFFFLSGLVTKHYQKEFSKYLKSRIFTLLIPYFALAFIQLSFEIIKLHRKGTLTSDFLLIDIQGIILLTKYWFIGALFYLEILYYFIRRYIKSTRIIWILLLLSSMIGFVLNKYIYSYPDFILYPMFRIFFSAIVFYAIGDLLKERILSYDWKIFFNNKKYSLILFLIFIFNLSSLLIFLKYYKTIGIADPQNYFLFYSLSLSGIFLTLVITQILSETRFLSFIGSNTLAIYILHSNPGIILKLFKAVNINLNYQYFLHAFFASVLIILILLPFIWLFNRYAVNKYLAFK